MRAVDITQRFMKMLSYIDNRAVVYSCLEELEVDPMAARVCTPGWDISVIAKMP
jgi:hypothetical protein